MSSAAGALGEVHAVHQLFEEHARRAPEAVAVVCGDERLTYTELNTRADRLAHRLAGSGLGSGGLAAVALARGPGLLTALLAVLKTGAAYVPLEPTAPDAAVRHVLADADPLVLLTEEAYRVRLTDTSSRTVLCVDTAAESIAAEAATPLGVTVQPSDPACVFYTSGSTGLPKGALVEHRNLLHSYRGWQSVYRLSPTDRFLQTATLEFDVFTADWIRALGAGGTLVMARRNFTLDRTTEISELHELVLREAVTVMETNVHTLRRLFAHLLPRGLELGEVRLLSVGAEKWYLDEQLRLQRYLGPGVRHINVYGVAEAAVDSTYFDSSTLAEAPEDAERISLIGQPFPGTRVHLLDASGRPVPPGRPGEICLAGPGVGRGYLNRPELTAARFQAAEFDQDGRIYRTGDIGRLRPDGLLEYIGRATDRADGTGTADASEVTALAEIEAELRTHPDVRESAVARIETAPGQHRLVAYAVTAATADAGSQDTGSEHAVPEGLRVTEGVTDGWVLRTYLAERLPERLLPDAVVPLPAMPLTRAGKLDRRSLPQPAPRDHAAGTARPGPGKTSVQRRGSAKAGYRPPRTGGGGAASSRGASAVVLTLLFAVLAFATTDVFWPGSTDVTAVPSPWAALFQVLYVCEWLGFGAGMAFLFLGQAVLERQRPARPARLTGLTVAAIAWLLIAWWPQDNWYRTSSPTDWPRQAALVYGFNVTLIIAALVVVRFLAWQPQTPKR
ncbi:amino acid adenylation domain-containing protein [Kitasatospora sp. GP82]|uniref:amino acid adenylation domain-containing protein n=1 Tax=Kitasatospora sp. GP82 TaxID=3035089 RepID=UPI002473C599|nr:amino acid adenylation domain-containing protein [Kitasatospora sp. GP82]MDH6125817.1 amino acid adenylation domain-containing protein [Kitasatospora sp. GP82]